MGRLEFLTIPATSWWANASKISLLVISIVTKPATCLPRIPFQLMISIPPRHTFWFSKCLKGLIWRGIVVVMSTWSLKEGSLYPFSVLNSQFIVIVFPMIPIKLNSSFSFDLWSKRYILFALKSHKKILHSGRSNQTHNDFSAVIKKSSIVLFVKNLDPSITSYLKWCCKITLSSNYIALRRIMPAFAVKFLRSQMSSYSKKGRLSLLIAWQAPTTLSN